MNSPRFLEAVETFNSHEYFLAHDIFEELWGEANGDERIFLQGVVQISVGCFHLVSGNMNGAKSQIEKGIAKISRFSPVFAGVNLNSLVSDLKNLIFQTENSNLFTEQLLKLLPEIKLTIKENPLWQ